MKREGEGGNAGHVSWNTSLLARCYGSPPILLGDEDSVILIMFQLFVGSGSPGEGYRGEGRSL